jgi:carotenoid cleavage dioxygenase-like enzyme
LSRCQQGRAGITDNASVTFYPSDDSNEEGVALAESIRAAIRVQRSTLETLSSVPLPPRNAIKGVLASAHPKPVPGGWHVNINHSIPFGRIQVVRTKIGLGASNAAPLFDLKVSNGRMASPWMHDLAVTDRHIALIEQPLYVSLKVRAQRACSHAPLPASPVPALRAAHLYDGQAVAIEMPVVHVLASGSRARMRCA